MEVVEALLQTNQARSSARSPRSTASGTRAGGPPMIDAFLTAVRALGDATPSDKDLAISRAYLATLNEQTAIDHLKSMDEMLSSVPTEFQAAVKNLSDAEAFITLCASGQVEKVQRALERNWDLVNVIDRDGHTALHAAAAQGATDVAEALIKKGANPSVQDYEGYTPLHWAVENNSSELVALLLRHGSDSSVRNNNGFTPYDMVHMLKPKHQTTMFGMLGDPRRGSVTGGSVLVGASAASPIAGGRASAAM